MFGFDQGNFGNVQALHGLRVFSISGLQILQEGVVHREADMKFLAKIFKIL